MRRSALVGLRPGVARLLASLAAAVTAAGLGWFVGAPPSRTALAAAAVLALGLLLRTAEPMETRWPAPPARRTRPGWHVVSSTQRAMEAARADRDDRRALAARLDALDAAAPVADPRTDAARAAVGLPTSPRRPR